MANCPEEIAASLPAGVKLEIDVLRREHGPTRAMPERIAVRCDDAGAEITVAMGAAARTSTVDLGGLAAEHRAARPGARRGRDGARDDWRAGSGSAAGDDTAGGTATGRLAFDGASRD